MEAREFRARVVVLDDELDEAQIQDEAERAEFERKIWFAVWESVQRELNTICADSGLPPCVVPKVYIGSLVGDGVAQLGAVLRTEKPE